ncbi:endonuclease domain-containing protein [Chloroflexales bacterium ZM16-3]|nr:endonuclease domain-containing protein [Chloroflexales bacterium ZM16-3]
MWQPNLQKCAQPISRRSGSAQTPIETTSIVNAFPLSRRSGRGGQGVRANSSLQYPKSLRGSPLSNTESRRRIERAHRERARELRRAQTPAEQLLWQELRGGKLDVRFRRQHPIDRFIADFCCIERRLIIEIDGAIHADQVEYDQERTVYLVAEGYTVLRFSNQQVLHERNAVLTRIQAALEANA